MIWEQKPLAEVADFCLGKMLDQNKNRGEALPYLANVNVRWGDFDFENLREMRFEPGEIERYGLRYGDIVMCEGGEPGRCAVWKDQVPGMMIQKALHRIRPHACLDSTFLFYAFLKKRKNDELSGLFTGSTIKHLPKEKLAKVKVDIPPIAIQRRIASILSAYDDLIENNRRRIALLEEAARMLYREWFVHFRFPGHEHVNIIDGLPEGWERRNIRSACRFLGRGISPSYDDDGEYLVVSQKCVRNRLFSLEQSRRQTKEFKVEKALRHLDVLINSTGTGTLGRVAQCWFAPEKTTFDSHVTVARANDSVEPLWFGYAIMELETVFEGMGEGATNQKELSKSRIADVLLKVPPKNLQSLFSEFAANTATQIQVLADQNQKLAQARDLILPRLMNGEIAV